MSNTTIYLNSSIQDRIEQLLLYIVIIIVLSVLQYYISKNSKSKYVRYALPTYISLISSLLLYRVLSLHTRDLYLSNFTFLRELLKVIIPPIVTILITRSTKQKNMIMIK